MKITNGQKH